MRKTNFSKSSLSACNARPLMHSIAVPINVRCYPDSDMIVRCSEPTLWATNGHVAYGSGVSNRIIDRFKIRPGGNTLAAMPANRSDRFLIIDLIVSRRF